MKRDMLVLRKLRPRRAGESPADWMVALNRITPEIFKRASEGPTEMSDELPSISSESLDGADSLDRKVAEVDRILEQEKKDHQAQNEESLSSFEE